MLFCPSGDAKLIDFDLTDWVNTYYPPRYNDTLEERHSSAKHSQQ